MQNVDAKVTGNKLTIVVDLSKEFGRSSSGKTTIVASSQGNQAVDGHEDIKFGINVYKK